MTLALLQPPNSILSKIYDKIQSNVRLDFDDGIALITSYQKEELLFIQQLADLKRQQLVGDTVLFSSTMHLYPTNLCEFHCKFCSFYRKEGAKDAYLFSPSQLISQITPYVDQLTEVHIVGGCWPKCDLEYYVDLFSTIRKTYPKLHIKALSAIEYDYLAKLHNISYSEVFTALHDAGLSAVSGGGAEILIDSIREKISPGRLSSQGYLDVHKAAHLCGIKSNVTMLFHHIETEADIVNHLLKIRNLQDETGGINRFVPIKYASVNNSLSRFIKQPFSVQNIYLIYATSRLLLDNVFNIKSMWNYLGMDTAIESLSWGANDLASTLIEEKVFVSASDSTPVQMNIGTLSDLIRNCNKIPCLTTS